MSQTPEYGDAGPLRDVRTGMSVVDRTGDDIGTVDDMKIGDPSAVTGAGQTMEDRGGVLETFAEAFGAERDVPPQVAERLRRLGYLKVSKTMSPTDFYVAGDQVERVSDDTVHLSVERDDLYAT